MASTSRVQEIIEKTQKKQLMLGNKAVVQGLLEANVGFAAAYPGTPSTEIQMELYKLARKGQLYFEFSVNEKVAAEIAGAAALSGVRSALILKHVGFNVASDTLMALAYFGVKAGMVVIVVDDPGCLSSQNEQDSRLWGKLSHLPVIEPSTIQEVKDCISIAYRLSEKYNTIFLVRLTNFTALNTSEVEFTPINKKLNWDGKFEKDVQHIIPARYILHKGLHEKLELLQDDEMFLQFNSLITKKEENSEKLIVTQGVTYSIVNYLLEHLKIEIPVFKVNAIYPLSEKQWIELLANYKYLYFIEE
ncbi:MAG TPA: indolepyruvate ferredoxin oxidoreductase subunit alpha, partial [candidate division Zixibacteria bacterium]|nr:indolepyruvate ferredoxin oxidoreductase subunit alpha [candidate division Zixibacteria bacterium]